MMLDNLLVKIADPKLNVTEMAMIAIRDPDFRAEIIRQMVLNPKIMVYFHCFYIVDEASRSRPDLFYEYWNDLAPLLDHPNSYHRDIALTVLANLTQADLNQYFPMIYDDYFKHLRDPKFMTSLCCLRNSSKIIRNLPDLTGRIVQSLYHQFEVESPYPQKQQALFKGVMIEVLDEVYALLGAEEREQALRFVRNELNSISPKTKKLAKVFIAKYCGS